MKRLFTLFCLILTISLFAENPPALKFSLYPNPAASYVEISLNETLSSDITVTISDILGNKINTYTFKPGQVMRIEFADLDIKTGIYLIKLEANEQVVLKRLVVKQ